jgi:hypothetical protein
MLRMILPKNVLEPGANLVKIDLVDKLMDEEFGLYRCKLEVYHR